MHTAIASVQQFSVVDPEASANAAEQVYADLVPRLEALAELSEADLPNEMQSLRGALLKNPEACSLMLPEHLGMLVTALRRMTGQALASAKAAKASKKAPKPKALTAAEVAAALADSSDF